MSKFYQIKTKPNQSIWDIAIEYYGSIEAVFYLIEDNSNVSTLHQILDVNTILNIRSNTFLNKEIAFFFNSSSTSPATQYPIHEVPVVIDLDYLFTDSDAATYYNALYVANGENDINSNMLYGISLNAFKAAIDTTVIALKNAGVYSKLVRVALMLGGTQETHSINLITSNQEFLFAGSPTQNANGCILDGFTQFVDLNNVPSADSAESNAHLMHWLDNVTGTNNSAGSRDNTFTGIYHRVASGNYNGQMMGITMNAGISIPNINGVFSSSVLSPVNRSFYVDDVLVDSSSTLQDGFNSSLHSTKVGAWTNAGTNINYSKGDVKFFSVGYGLTSTEISSYVETIKSLNTAINR